MTKLEINNICEQLQENQTNRKAVIKAQNKLKSQARAFVSRVMGYYSKMPEKEGAKICAEAAKIIKQIEKDDIDHPANAFVKAMLVSREPLDKYRKSLEKQMNDLVLQLPISKWWCSVPGLGAGGLAVILGETGNLNNYQKIPQIWKRMGVAPDGAYEMTTKAGKTAVAKPKGRRSVLFTIGDSVIKNNKDKNKVPGKYRQMYLDRKEYECVRNPEWREEGKKMRAHLRAQRYMEKKILKDLFSQWKRAA